MSFTIDNQTIDDLNLMGRFKPNSIFSLFNKVKTRGGERLLEEMFRRPMNDMALINKRSKTFCYFQRKQLNFPFEYREFNDVEAYLSADTASNYPMAIIANAFKKLKQYLVNDEQYECIYKGLVGTIKVLSEMQKLSDCFEDETDNPYHEQIRSLKEILTDKHLLQIVGHHEANSLSFLKVARLDYLILSKLRMEMEKLLEIIYEIDVFIAVSNVAREKGFSYANAVSAASAVFCTRALWHPVLQNPVANPLSLNTSHNFLFLTGANMAGKSTLMKSFGIAVYLSHLGFPVAAHNLEFSVKDGLYSSINVPDNLNQGLSHFYAEVLRVKHVAQEVSSGKNLAVIFDELFKGTNVKDAYDATLAVSVAFSKYKNCSFIISTHIIEVGEALAKACGNVLFSYLPTIMEGTIPRYPFKLETGITSDRQGMTLIKNEGILELLKM